MPYITFLPAQLTIEVTEQTTLREAAHQADLVVQDRCGGNGACASCSVRVVSGRVTPKSAAEEAVFYLTGNERLSCQTYPLGDATILIE